MFFPCFLVLLCDFFFNVYGFICIVFFNHCPYYSLLFCCFSLPLFFIIAIVVHCHPIVPCCLCYSLSSYCSSSLLILIIILLFVITILLGQVLTLLLHVTLLLFIITLLHVLLPPLFVVMVLHSCLQYVSCVVGTLWRLQQKQQKQLSHFKVVRFISFWFFFRFVLLLLYGSFMACKGLFIYLI